MRALSATAPTVAAPPPERGAPVIAAAPFAAVLEDHEARTAIAEGPPKSPPGAEDTAATTAPPAPVAPGSPGAASRVPGRTRPDASGPDAETVMSGLATGLAAAVAAVPPISAPPAPAPGSGPDLVAGGSPAPVWQVLAGATQPMLAAGAPNAATDLSPGPVATMPAAPAGDPTAAPPLGPPPPGVVNPVPPAQAAGAPPSGVVDAVPAGQPAGAPASGLVDAVPAAQPAERAPGPTPAPARTVQPGVAPALVVPAEGEATPGAPASPAGAAPGSGPAAPATTTAPARSADARDSSIVPAATADAPPGDTAPVASAPAVPTSSAAAAGAAAGAPVTPPPAAPTGPTAPATPVPTRRAVPLHEVVETVRLTLHAASDRGVTRARIALRPVELGGVDVLVHHSAEGLTARVVAESPEAAQLLQQAAGELRRSFDALGLTLLRVDVGTSGDREEAAGAGAGGGASGREGAGDGGARRGDRGGAGNPAAHITHHTIELVNGALVDVLA
jgi:hypothetical protein